ncbi:MAG TPA: thioredoxin family protein [Chthoniobacteraceae bacterium]|nr:thioredoxin family protein [Chthoniobacteraceae bacterium]
MIPLGTPLPVFLLPTVRTREMVSVRDFEGKQALLIIFLCAHCPYVQHVAPELARLVGDYAGESVAIMGITSNDATQYPEDAPAPTAAWAEREGLVFPILYDEAQDVARVFSAACTPDFFLFDSDRKLVYRGQLDDSRPSRGPGRPGRGELNGRDLRAAIDAVLSGGAVNAEQMPSIGCSIKWKPGHEPAHFG